MITQSSQPAHWQQVLKQAYRSADEILRALNLSANQVNLSQEAANQFSVRVPRGFVNCMQPGDPFDPLLRQVLPLQDELVVAEGYVPDPVQDLKTNPVPGLIHKYHGRVLVTLQGSCAIQCRYCFRRHFPYSDQVSLRHIEKIVAYVSMRPEVQELILSGGEPLLLSDAKLFNVIRTLETIPHLKRLRFHSRIPIVLPERLTSDFVEGLSRSHLQTVMVVHCNHANEVSPAVAAALMMLKHTGITLLNQAVLLKGVNDSLCAQIALHEKLFEAGVLPYYLHLLDPVSGASHFAVADDVGQRLHQQLLASLPGYLVPKLVKENPGQASKTWVNS